MTVDATALTVIVVVFAATLFRSTFGFGEALVAVPLLALVVPVEVAAPVAALVSITVAAVVVARDWRHVHVGGAGRLVLASLPGIPLGLGLLLAADERAVKAILGVVIVAFAASRLVGTGKLSLPDDRHAWLFGLAAGVLGGAYGMNGPPLAAYGALRRWSPAQFRATLQGYFLPASLAGVVGYAVAGLWTAEVTRFFLLALPTALVAIPLGRAANRRIEPERFLGLVHAGLAAIGALLIAQAIRR